MAGYPEISDHGLIGDLQTAALVTTDGTIGWFCSPRSGSPSVFAGLLDAGGGAHCRVAPDADGYVTRQLYLPDTAILINGPAPSGAAAAGGARHEFRGADPHRGTALQPAHSLIDQSLHSELGAETTNGDASAWLVTATRRRRRDRRPTNMAGSVHGPRPRLPGRISGANEPHYAAHRLGVRPRGPGARCGSPARWDLCGAARTGGPRRGSAPRRPAPPRRARPAPGPEVRRPGPTPPGRSPGQAPRRS